MWRLPCHAASLDSARSRLLALPSTTRRPKGASCSKACAQLATDRVDNDVHTTTTRQVAEQGIDEPGVL
jgi:hypothetical protein